MLIVPLHTPAGEKAYYRRNVFQSHFSQKQLKETNFNL